MNLAPRELDKLTLYTVAELARKRRARGVKLNYEEAIALICEAVLEGARDGKTVAQMMSEARHVVRKDECMDGVDDMLHLVQIEGTFVDGTKLVSVHDPIQ
jgi:urease subunit gamma